MSFVDSMLRSLRRMAGHIYGIYGPMSSLIKPLLYESYGNAAILASPICLGMFGRCFSSWELHPWGGSENPLGGVAGVHFGDVKKNNLTWFQTHSWTILLPSFLSASNLDRNRLQRLVLKISQRSHDFTIPNEMCVFFFENDGSFLKYGQLHEIHPDS